MPVRIPVPGPNFYEGRGQRKERRQRLQRFPIRPYRWKLYATASLGRLQAELGDYARARQMLLGVLREESGTDREQVFAEVGALENLADESYRQRADDATARENLRRNPGDPRRGLSSAVPHLVGNLRYYRSDYPDAAEHYRRAIAAAPTVAAYHRYLGVALRALSNFQGALIEIGRAFELDGDDKRRRDESASLANTQGNRAFESGSYRDAIAFYEQAVDLEPSTPVYQSNLALAFELLKEHGARIQQLEKAVAWYTRAQQVRGSGSRRAHRVAAPARGTGATVRRTGAGVARARDPIAVEIAEDLIPLVSGPTASSLSADLEREVEETRRVVADTLGIASPGVRFRVSERPLPSGTYVVLINDVPLTSGVASPGRRFFAGSAQELEARKVSGNPAVNPMTGEPGIWVAQKDWAAVTPATDRLWTVTRYMMRHLEAVIRRNAAEFVGHQEVVQLLANVSSDLRQAIRGASTTLSALVNVCRALAAENVTVGPFEELCKNFKTLYHDNIRPREIAERLRLLPAIRESLPGRNERSYLRASEGFEAEIRRSLYRKSDRIVLAITPERCQEALEAVRVRVGKNHGVAFVVADPAVRPFVRRLVEMEFHDLAVLSAAEARDNVESLSQRVDLDGSALPATASFQSPHAPGTSVPQQQTAGGAGTVNESACSVEIAVARGLPTPAAIADDNGVDGLLSLLRDGLFQELGMFVPQISLRENADFPEAAFEYGSTAANRSGSRGCSSVRC